MKRLDNWQELLNAAIRGAQSQAFQWGVFDCAKWVCDAVRATTGTDMYAEFRDKYSTRNAAALVIRNFCGGGLAALAEKMANMIGAPEVQVSFARRGDVVLVNEGKYDSLAIVDDVYALCAGKTGLVRVPRVHWRRAWKIG